MNMERSTGPRIYVPISMPDHGSQPAYAVLEFVGFSSPAPGAHLLRAPAPVPSPAPAMLCLPPAPSSSSSGSPSSFYPAAGARSHAMVQAPLPPLIQISHFPADSNPYLLPSPSHLPPPYSHHQQHHPYMLPALPPSSSTRPEAKNLDSPPPSPPSLAPSSASSASRESSTPAMAGNASGAPPTPIICFAPPISDASSALVNGSNPRPAEAAHSCGLPMPRANFCHVPERDLMQTKISVSQTDRETIVHTHSSNFRDVVRQLTGASSDDQDLRPVTLPARLANRVNNTNMLQSQSNGGAELGTSGAGAASGGFAAGISSREQLGLRKAPLKLHERRKSTMKNLEKVTSAFCLHGAAEVSPIMNPSPVTPLASDFERCCNASTPSSQGSSGLSSPVVLLGRGKGAMEAAGQGTGEQNQKQEGGRFFSLQHPLASSLPEKPLLPTLLSLFPESPTCSPQER